MRSTMPACISMAQALNRPCCGTRNAAVAGALDDPAVMRRDCRINEVASERPQPRQNPVLIGSGKPRVADNVGHQGRGEFSRLAHRRTRPPSTFGRRVPRGDCTIAAARQTFKERLRLGDLRHFRRRRKTFERGREDRVGVGWPGGRLVEFRERQ